MALPAITPSLISFPACREIYSLDLPTSSVLGAVGSYCVSQERGWQDNIQSMFCFAFFMQQKLYTERLKPTHFKGISSIHLPTVLQK